MSDAQTPEQPRSHAPARLSYVSTPALVTGVGLSAILMVGALWVWYALGPDIRAQVTWLQAATLLFFVVFMIAIMLTLGYSHLWAEDGEVVIRNGPVMRRFRTQEIAGLRLRKGDPWAYLLIKDPTAEDGLRRRAVLAIQSLEGDGARKKVVELRNWLVVNGASSEGIRPE
jgi:hypothetical protein